MDLQAKICVLYGGMSAERDISLKSGKNVYDALAKKYKNVTLVDVDKNIAKRLVELEPDLCIIALHGTYGEDGSIQGLLEMMKIKYTGSGVAASAIGFDKLLAKHTFSDYGLLVPKSVLLEKNTEKAPFLPCVVKPTRQGSSIGVSVVKDEESFKQAVAEAFKYDDKVICEEYISGKELTVPVMNDEAFPPIWVRPKSGFYDFKNKYTAGMTDYLLDTDLPKERLDELATLAKRAYKACSCRSMARVDFIATEDKFYVIEINTVPGMTATSLVPKSAGKLGISFDEIVERIMLTADLDNK